MFGFDTKIIDLVGCQGKYAGTMRECHSRGEKSGAIPGPQAGGNY